MGERTVIKDLGKWESGFFTLPQAHTFYFVLYKKTTTNIKLENLYLNMVSDKRDEKYCFKATDCYDDAIYFSEINNNDKMLSSKIHDKSFLYIPPGKYIVTIVIEGDSKEEISNLLNLVCRYISTKKLLADKYD